MKKISKNKIDSLIYLARLYWSTGDGRLLNARIGVGHMIEEESGIDWCAIIDFIDSIVKYKGLSPDADNETIYNGLKLFGWDVVENVEVNTAD